MGILDDAIRQHLELKRRHGAPDAELQQMEDEAFGPPTRPGEPDFPESDTSLEQTGNGVVETTIAESPGPSEAETTIAESPAAPEAPTAPPPDVPGEEPGEPFPDGPSPDEEGEPEDHAEPPAAPPVAEEEPAAEHPVVETLPDDVPIESLETVEHPFPEEIVEPEEPAAEDGEGEPPPAQSEEESVAAPHEPDEGDGTGDSRDDVLADTPDFLRDAPEDDELWFEQGEPKDFDF